MFDLYLMERGGPMMWPLLIMGIVALMLSIERAVYLHKGKVRAGEFLMGIKNLLKKRRLVEALTVCEETPAPIASVVKAALINHDQPEARIIGAVQNAALVELPNLERRVGTLGMIARVAPLMGLLGTVLALYLGFVDLEAEGPYANVAMFSTYVTQALISTGAGLLLAIVSWLMYHFLYGRVRAIVHDMEWVGHDLIQYMMQEVDGVAKEADDEE